MIFDMKGITIEHKDLAEINPLSIKSKMDKDGFKLEYGKIVDVEEYILGIIKDNLQELNNKRYMRFWNDNEKDYKIKYKLFNEFKIVFAYEKNYSNTFIKLMEIHDKNDKVLTSTVCNYCSLDSLCEEDLNNNEKFFNTYKKWFNDLTKQFHEYCKNNIII